MRIDRDVPLIVDAGVLYAQADINDEHHQAAAELLRNEVEELVTSELVVAEADYLILGRLGIEAELRFLDDLAEGTFVVECLTRAELDAARRLVVRYRDVRLGLADCSLVILAGRHRTLRIATFDERHFRPITGAHGDSFTILPADRPR